MTENETDGEKDGRTGGDEFDGRRRVRYSRR